ncbi:MAG: hypothetical protein F2893_03130 [Actinobacteria bacterium]|uniref:Unannotated protein n=1 Tax=freshwater metagenome TaxID=449393 RepID=A0A6J7PP35_9ZZZZ|nr:hypothetical protein [Actinomycetota bacterium]MSV39438.1 hypothetical protein [Actinomycetota bacterium]MSY49388.1 hypothetical protein [Actinomycetota bacterium]MTH91450.1 hypothetical protein [Actinomycetota bacterium]
MTFAITHGDPTPEERAAIETMMANHKREELEPVIKRSVYGRPQLRQPLPHQITFGARARS